MTWVYDFDHDHGVPPRTLAGLLGGKGASLAEMTTVLGLPVPPGFTITTEACSTVLHGGRPPGLDDEVDAAIDRLEARVGRRLGDVDDPLLVSVRSGAPRSMPGMLATVLDVGLGDASLAGLAARIGERSALDCYRRLLASHAVAALGLDGERFAELVAAARRAAGAESDADLPVEALRDLVARSSSLVQAETGQPFPQEARVQLRGAIDAVLGSWAGPRAVAYRRREGIPDHLGTAVSVQAMVFGNRGRRSGTGVAFSRDPSTGEPGAYGDYLVQAQGADVVDGARVTQPLAAMAAHVPGAHAELLVALRRLEHHLRDLCDVEFTVEEGHLWLLQARVGQRTGAAAVRIAVDLVDDPDVQLTRAEALRRIAPASLEQAQPARLGDHGEGEVLARGLGASPGAAVGRVRLTSAAAVAAADRGEDVILVRAETSPDDVQGMLVAAGVLTSRGGLVSHAAIVARGWGTPAVVGAMAVEVGPHGFRVGDVEVAEGDLISIDGTTGEVLVGAVERTGVGPSPAVTTLLGWADDVCERHAGPRPDGGTGAARLRAALAVLDGRDGTPASPTPPG